MSTLDDVVLIKYGMKKIPVVDDDNLILLLLKQELEKQNLAIEAAADGAQAMKKMGVNRPDLVITDINMPEMGGLELLETVRESSQYKNIPVLCITGDNELETKQVAIGLGATGRVEKPFNPQTWGATLRKIPAS